MSKCGISSVSSRATPFRGADFMINTVYLHIYHFKMWFLMYQNISVNWEIFKGHTLKTHSSVSGEGEGGRGIISQSTNQLKIS